VTERVLITSAQERFALAACRSLWQAGYGVSAVADQTPAATHWSRCCSGRYVLVDAKQDADRFVDGIADILRVRPHAAFLPATDAALLVVSARRDRLEGLTRLGLPPHDVVQAATDKAKLFEAGQSSGLSVPETVTCRSDEDGRAAAEAIGFPVVIKPIRTAFELDGKVVFRNGVYVPDAETLEGLLDRFGSPYVVQRVQQGSVYSAAGVRTEDGIVAFALARYLRTFPPEAGNVAFAETVEPPPGLEDRIDALLGGLGWTGIWELEMIRADDGSFHAIDLNPRLYGSLALATRAGAPLAAVLCDWLLGKPVRRVVARAGVRYRWEDADLRYVLRRLRERRFSDAVAALKPRRDVAHAHFRLNDPAPLFARALALGLARGRR
jgi:predicted ATP-grasp superfamily ATP-dependent carboligase